MAEVVSGDKNPIKLRTRYDFDSWFDGRAWRLVQEVDFFQSIVGFRCYLYQMAKKRNVEIATKREGIVLYVQKIGGKNRNETK